jgi:hypothetical protein
MGENREYMEKIKMQSTFWLKPPKVRRKKTGKAE